MLNRIEKGVVSAAAAILKCVACSIYIEFERETRLERGARFANDRRIVAPKSNIIDQESSTFTVGDGYGREVIAIPPNGGVRYPVIGIDTAACAVDPFHPQASGEIRVRGKRILLEPNVRTQIDFTANDGKARTIFATWNPAEVSKDKLFKPR